jgi:methylenetetrahydrofolate reductase (NADPH)
MRSVVSSRTSADVADDARTFFATCAKGLEYLVRDELAALGATTPVIPSVFPVINVAGITRMAAMNGSVIPAPLLQRLEAAATPEDVASIGVEAATEICRRLLDAGVPGIHLYPMNRSESVRRIVDNLGLGG